MSAGVASCILAIDQGTTSTRAIIFDQQGVPCAEAARELPQVFPAAGWVEHDASEIWRATQDVCRRALAQFGDVRRIAAIGLTNQRETTVLWDRATGLPLYNAIVWQDRRTADQCAALKARGLENEITEKTGLLLDPYFSATKIAWLLEHIPGARERAGRGELACGTIDAWLIWNLTKGARHVTDVTNASRTMLFNIESLEWDSEILSWLDIPRELLPDVLDCAGDFGVADSDILGADIPICGVAGDQQAASIGQACFEPGMLKSTYGTGCFVLLNTGSRRVRSSHRLLTTLAYRLKGETVYAVEGSIFMAGATVQWLRDGLNLIEKAEDTENLAAQADPEGGIYMVPAFTGLGAPYWDPHARASIVGLTRDAGIPDLVRAALDAVCYQTRDLMEAMASDDAQTTQSVRVDGGMAENAWFMQRLADIIDRPVERPHGEQATALGAAYLAGLEVGLYPSTDHIARQWRLAHTYDPALPADSRETLYDGWRDAIARTLSRN